MKKRIGVLLDNNHGFTRLQNLMIVMIILILAGVGVYAFFGYSRSSYQVKANNTARKVYESASQYLADQAEYGQLETFNRRSSHFGGLVTMDFSREILKSLYQGNDFDEFFRRFETAYQDVPIRYVMLNAQSLDEEDRAENPVLQMLEYKVLDGNILKHTFLIEYNGNTGQVLGVLYSEKAESFTYDGDTGKKSNVIRRDTQSLKEKWQGYYGADLEELE